jgi:hypothetical protein
LPGEALQLTCGPAKQKVSVVIARLPLGKAPNANNTIKNRPEERARTQTTWLPGPLLALR